MKKRKQLEYMFYASLIVISFLFLLFPTGLEYVIFDDSETYIKFLQMRNVEGVMPIYPIFLFFNKLIFGKDFYLQAVMAEQTLIAILCVTCFISKMKRHFQLRYRECYLLLLLSLIPFTTDYPLSMVVQDIVTEGLSYALFYLFVVLLLDAVWERSFVKLLETVCFTFVLALLRSQLQILFAVCGAAAAYVIWVKFSTGNKWSYVGKAAAGFGLWAVVMMMGIVGTVRINYITQRILFGEGKVATFIDQNSSDMIQPIETAGILQEEKEEELERNPGEVYKESSAIHQATSGLERIGDGVEIQEPNTAPNTAPEVIEFLSNGYEESGVAVSQYSSIIFSKGMYEADYEDYLLFEDEEVQKQFLYVYELVDELGYRYPYADSGLWGWRHISDSVGDLGKHCFWGLNEYFADYYNTTIAYFQYRCTAQAFQTIGTKLLVRHFGRFVWHTVRLMIPAFIFTVFFQKEQFYLLCHLVTLFLYVTAAGLTIWCFIHKRANKRCAEFMLVVLANNFILVAVISLVFIGLQRYLVYGFGIFYVAYYLLLRELYRCCFVDKIRQRFWMKK